VNNRTLFPVVCLWTACEVRGMDPQALRPGHASRPPAGGPGGNRAGAVRRVLHTGMPLRDWRHALFPIVHTPYSYNL
jgi:hypothetical protein